MGNTARGASERIGFRRAPGRPAGLVAAGTMRPNAFQPLARAVQRLRQQPRGNNPAFPAIQPEKRKTMKLNRLLLVTLTGLAPVFAFAVSPKPTAPAHSSGRSEVQFLEAEKYTDVGGSVDDKSDKNGYLNMLRDHVDRLAGEFVPEGQKIALTFTDIDLAGDFPPGRNASVDQIRVMKDIYPPRMAFSYRITDASG